jgi:hypothetical protein
MTTDLDLAAIGNGTIVSVILPLILLVPKPLRKNSRKTYFQREPISATMRLSRAWEEGVWHAS